MFNTNTLLSIIPKLIEKNILLLALIILLISPNILMANKKIFNLAKNLDTNKADTIIFDDKKRDYKVIIMNYSDEGILDLNAKRLIYLKNIIDKFDNFGKPTSLNFNIFKDGTISASMITSSFNYQGREYKNNITSGILFVLYSDEILYSAPVLVSDKRVINKDEYFTSNIKIVNVRGVYKNEEDLLFSIAIATEDPSVYLEDDNTTALSENIVNLQNEINRTKKMLILSDNIDISSENIETTMEYINRIIILKSRNKDLSIEDIAKQLKEDKQPVKRRIIYSVFRVYFNEEPKTKVKVPKK